MQHPQSLDGGLCCLGCHQQRRGDDLHPYQQQHLDGPQNIWALKEPCIQKGKGVTILSGGGVGDGLNRVWRLVMQNVILSV